MKLAQIKRAIELGESVFWSNTYYEVILDNKGQYLIKGPNNYCIGLTWVDEFTLNGEPDDFFMWSERDGVIAKLVDNDIETIWRNAEIDDYSYLNNILTGEGFTQYGDMTIKELNDEWQEVFLFNLYEEEEI